jgi:hypothetical protein
MNDSYGWAESMNERILFVQIPWIYESIDASRRAKEKAHP